MDSEVNSSRLNKLWMDSEVYSSKKVPSVPLQIPTTSGPNLRLLPDYISVSSNMHINYANFLKRFTLVLQRDSSYSRLGSAMESPMAPSINKDWTPRNYYKPSGSRGYFPPDPLDQGGNQHYNVGSSMEASRTTTSSREEASVSISNASDVDSEWVAEDEPGVYITIRQLADGTRELRRVRFSREKFGEVNAKLWWEQNRDRIQAQYL